MVNKASATIAPARRCAFVVLRRTFEHRAYTDRALRAEARGLDTRDRALAMRLANGAVQRKGTLDHFIERLAERPVRRLDARVLAALRLGLYELLYLAGAPDRAVVADAVELAKTGDHGGHGLVNAVLRRAAREGAGELLGSLSDATPEQAAVMHSHPQWIARLWWEQLGAADARALMACDNEPAEVALRANTLVTDARALAAALPVPTHFDPALPEALVLEGPFDLHASELWQQGAVLAQSRAAMLVARALAPRAGERVLDLCAAPGGKATHLAALMAGGGEVVAVERNARRARRLELTARRLRASSVRVEVSDARIGRGERGVFDRVLVDPPCSGLGTLQSRPDLRWRTTPEAVAQMARAQAQILAAGAGALRPGGVLVYSSCTISPTENEQVIAAFLDSHPDFSLDDLAAAPTPAATGLITSAGRRGSGFLLTLPHRDRTAGFFIARLRRG
ncbi:MAG: 16S rRNA (cytosine(967)-C(5))-methyltransferase RsmB [Actinobacteria bacterium]|nr:MAG: 16S rRNA (cytosine(967)-C(5))-methyltransferase RsmB [Actinomycetota bacterium]